MNKMNDFYQLKAEMTRKQQRGLHFILASIIIWMMVACVHATQLDPLMKNLLTFCCTAPLVPIAWMISRFIGVEFSDKSTPFSSLGIILSCNQMLYLLIAMWIYAAIPDKMVMVIAIIFGAHLLPFGWLYSSKAYYIMSVVVSIGALVVGLLYPPIVLACVMIGVEILFSLWLRFENKSKE
ncbi:MAG: hypothetical protein K5856_04400 [Bacteroidaceae bacterium]|nr:hypothetical protein [Bacteroidaceae bacterium]